jgi:hypothetical protein
MGAPEGNQFWRLRAKHGPNRKFENGEDLWNACCEYFQWVEDNPLIEEKVFASKGEILTYNACKMRAMTITGLSVFLGIDLSTWYEWKKRNDLSKVITRVEAIIWDQKFTGAAAELLNHNIIAREIGLMTTPPKEVDDDQEKITKIEIVRREKKD